MFWLLLSGFTHCVFLYGVLEDGRVSRCQAHVVLLTVITYSPSVASRFLRNNWTQSFGQSSLLTHFRDMVCSMEHAYNVLCACAAVHQNMRTGTPPRTQSKESYSATELTTGLWKNLLLNLQRRKYRAWLSGNKQQMSQKTGWMFLLKPDRSNGYFLPSQRSLQCVQLIH